jgi:hypothetical protein
MAASTTKTPLVVQVLGRVLEAEDLGVLGEEVVEGVEHEVDEPVAAGQRHRRHVAARDGYCFRAGLGSQPVDHRRGLLDPVDGESRRGQRKGDAARADRELEGGPSGSQVLEEGDGLGLVAPRTLIVGARYVRAEAGHRVETAHGDRLNRRGPPCGNWFARLRTPQVTQGRPVSPRSRSRANLTLPGASSQGKCPAPAILSTQAPGIRCAVSVLAVIGIGLRSPATDPTGTPIEGSAASSRGSSCSIEDQVSA